MIGNSLKSDVLPVLGIGGHAIHIPFHTTWAHEKIDHNVEHNNFMQFEKIADILLLVADDEKDVVSLLKDFLELKGYCVYTANNGKQAIEQASKSPDLILLDVNMPEMGGLEALPLIRAASPKTAVVMVTGSADKTVVAIAASHGASGYIIKPLRPAHVVAYMDRLFK